MTLKKHGTGEITQPNDQADSKKEAAKDWTEQDQQELEAELRDDDSPSD